MISFDLSGRTALVTGGSRGIGRATAELLVRAGARVVVNYQSDEKAAESLAEALHGESGAVVLSKGSVTQGDFVKKLVEEILDRWGRIDVLVNNAGINRDNYLAFMSEKQWDEVFDVNVKSMFHCCRAVLKPMIAQRRGSIINLSSIAAVTGREGQVNYAASKAAVLALTKSLAQEVGRYNVRVNAIVCGMIDTDMTKRLPRKIINPVIAATPLGRIGMPSEIASLALFLASDHASFITGSCITATGGL